MFSKQETFDKVVEHLRKQNCCAIEASQCKYRDSKGRSCAAGCLIPDAVYKREYEGTTVKDTDGKLSLVGHLIVGLGHDIELVSSLQSVHDTYDVIYWEENFKKVAETHKLIYKPKQITHQETFDKVVAHLRSQQMKSQNSLGECVYRGPNGLKCAAGCLIPDDKYKPEMENQSCFGIKNRYFGNDKYPAITIVETCLKEQGYNPEFVRLLQLIHDSTAVIYWEQAFKNLATKHNLIYTEPVI